MQAFTNFFTIYHLNWMIPIIAIMIFLGSLGGTINWVISPAIITSSTIFTTLITKRKQIWRC
jgi:hypothetical protein